MLAKILIPVTSLSREDEVRTAADRAKPEGRPKARANSLLIPALPPARKACGLIPARINRVPRVFF